MGGDMGYYQRPQLRIFSLKPTLEEFDEMLRDVLSGFKRGDWKNLVYCYSCGDVYPRKLRDLVHQFCLPCFLEFGYGIIPNGTGRQNDRQHSQNIEEIVRNQTHLHLIEKSA